MQIYTTYTQLLERLEKLGRPLQMLGRTPDGSPVVAVRAGGDKLPARIGAKITEDFGGLAQFKEAFKQAGVTQFGSGWCWLILKADGKLAVTKTPNGANPVSTGEGTPILGCDVWEHAYYLDFRNVRPNYIQNFLDRLVNWDVVESLMLNGGMASGQAA